MNVCEPTVEVLRAGCSVDAPQLPADVDAGAARAARVPRVAAARADQRALGADRAAAGPLVPQPALRGPLAAGETRTTSPE